MNVSFTLQMVQPKMPKKGSKRGFKPQNTNKLFKNTTYIFKFLGAFLTETNSALKLQKHNNKKLSNNYLCC